MLDTFDEITLNASAEMNLTETYHRRGPFYNGGFPKSRTAHDAKLMRN